MSRGASISLLDGLVLHEDILTPDEQATLLHHVDTWVASGANGSLAGKSYEAPPDEWRKTGQGRVAILFGVHVKCNKVSNANVEPLPPPLVQLLDKFQAANIFTHAERPDTACVNVYEAGAWLPPHVDSDAFDRPFCTVSLLSAQRAIFGETIEGTNGEWSGECEFSMPLGSVLRVDGAAAGPRVKHALPRASDKRVSITFRRLGRKKADEFESIREASAAAALAKRERRIQAKEAKGHTRKEDADAAAAAASSRRSEEQDDAASPWEAAPSEERAPPLAPCLNCHLDEEKKARWHGEVANLFAFDREKIAAKARSSDG